MIITVILAAAFTAAVAASALWFTGRLSHARLMAIAAAVNAVTAVVNAVEAVAGVSRGHVFVAAASAGLAVVCVALSVLARRRARS